MSFGDFSHAREAQRAPGLASLVPMMKIAPPAMGKAEAVRAFNAHADGTNDIFHLAAQLIAGVLLRADRIIQSASASGMQSWEYVSQHSALLASLTDFSADLDDLCMACKGGRWKQTQQ